MKQTLLLFNSCFVLFSCSWGQNLIPDPGFEHNKYVPTEFSLIGASHNWSRPSLGTTDLFCKCDRQTKIKMEKAYSFVDVPQNPMGFQLAHSGTCYAGFFLLSHGEYREYLQTPLTQALEKNKVYEFSLFISLADYSTLSIDQLGVCFLNSKASYSTTEIIPDLEPLYMKLEDEVGNEVEDWHEITCNYVARGGESFVLFGSFEINKINRTFSKPPKEVRTRINQVVPRDAYYYVDDVSLTEIPFIEGNSAIEVLEPDPAPEISTDTLMTFKHVLFQTNEAILLPASYPELNTLVEHLKTNPKINIEIFGHTDNSGNEVTNKKLSTERARAVKDYLTTRGIDRSRVVHEGYGSSKPVASNETEEGKQQNRRVEFRLTEH